MSTIFKTYSCLTLLLFLTILTFAYILPSGMSFENDFVVFLTFAYLLVIYIPVLYKLVNYIINNFSKMIEQYKKDQI